jgi:hypothetical protein
MILARRDEAQTFLWEILARSCRAYLRRKPTEHGRPLKAWAERIPAAPSLSPIPQLYLANSSGSTNQDVPELAEAKYE